MQAQQHCGLCVLDGPVCAQAKMLDKQHSGMCWFISYCRCCVYMLAGYFSCGHVPLRPLGELINYVAVGVLEAGASLIGAHADYLQWSCNAA